MRKVERNNDILPLGARPTYYFGRLDGGGECPIRQVWFVDKHNGISSSAINNADPVIEFPILDCTPQEQAILEEKLVYATPIKQLWIVDAGKNKKAIFGIL